MQKFIYSILFITVSTFLNAVEYGVVLLPSKNDSALLSALQADIQKAFTLKGISLSKETNLPHITLFEGAFDANDLGKLMDAVGKYAEKRSKTTVKVKRLESKRGFVLLSVTNTPELTKLFDRFYDARIYEIRAKSKVLKRLTKKKESGLSPEKNALFEKYGLYWNIPGNFETSVSLCFGDKKTDGSAALTGITSSPKEVTIDRVAVVGLGIEGNVLDVLAEFPLLN